MNSKLEIDKAKQISQNKFKLKEFINENVAEEIYKLGKTAATEKRINKLLESDKTGEFIYRAGVNWVKFNYKKGLDKLLEVDKSGEYILRAGGFWPHFDFKKGFDKIIKMDETGGLTYEAGENWKEFDYKRGLDKLIELDKTGGWIIGAGDNWKEFDYEKGLKALEGTEYYEDALNDWWKKSPKIAKIKNELVKKNAKQFPQKKFKLKESTNEEKEAIKEVYLKGKKNSSQKNFDKLLELDEIGYLIFLAGFTWKKFDYKKGLNRLIEVDESGEYIYRAGNSWKEFDFEKGLDALIKIAERIDKNHITWAGNHIVWAGEQWEEFNYKKAIKALEGTALYKIAIDSWWKKSPEIAKIKNKLEIGKATQMPPKKFKLKKFVSEEFKDYAKTPRKGLIAIYKNPTKSEIREASQDNEYKRVRYIVDFKTKSFYVFDAELLHVKAAKVINLPYDILGERIAVGIGQVKNGDLVSSFSYHNFATTEDRELEVKRDKEHWVREYIKFE